MSPRRGPPTGQAAVCRPRARSVQPGLSAVDAGPCPRAERVSHAHRRPPPGSRRRAGGPDQRRRRAGHPRRQHPRACPVPGLRPARGSRARDARGCAGRGLHRLPARGARAEARRDPGVPAAVRYRGGRRPRGHGPVHPRLRVARPPPRRGRHRGGRRRCGAHRDRGGGAGLRGLRHPRARVRLGRLQGAGPPGQGAPHPQQRSRGRPGALRRQDPALVRPVGLQVRDGGEGRGRGRDHPPHPAQRRLPVAGGADLLVRAPVLAPVLRAEGTDARVDHRGGLPAAPGAPEYHPRGAGARGWPPRLPSRPAGHRGHRWLRQPGRADPDGERARAAPGQRLPALVRGGALHRPPRPPRDALRRAARARTPSTTGPRTTPPGWP